MGQTDSQVKYLSHGSGYTLFLTPTEAVLSLSNPAYNSGALHGTDATSANAPTGPEAAQNATFRMRIIGSNERALVTGLRELPGRTNYLIGNDPSKWHTDIPTYASVEYQQVYPGIDLLYYGNRRQLEYDFIIAPGANPDSIRLGLSGTRQPKIDPDGDLVLPVGDGELRLRKPTIYQKIGGIHSPVEGGYSIHPLSDEVEGYQVSFTVGGYDPTRPLVIDPVLIYSTYLGGITTDVGQGIDVDTSGSAYVTGWTLSADFPGTGGNVAPKIGPGGSTDAFVTKLNPTGSAIVYSTYLGGTFADVARDVGVHNATGNACVVGDSQSSNTFPTTPNAFQNTVVGAGDVFVTCLNPSGSGLVYSTFLSGNNGSVGSGVDVHSSGNVYATGRADSQGFPITANAFTGDFGGITDVFVAVIDPTMTGSASLLYSTFLGGFSNDVGEDVAADAAGNAYVTGQTLSSNTNPLLQAVPHPECFPARSGPCRQPGGLLHQARSHLNRRRLPPLFHLYWRQRH